MARPSATDPPSKVAAIVTTQPFISGSLTVAWALGASGPACLTAFVSERTVMVVAGIGDPFTTVTATGVGDLGGVGIARRLADGVAGGTAVTAIAGGGEAGTASAGASSPGVVATTGVDGEAGPAWIGAGSVTGAVAAGAIVSDELGAAFIGDVSATVALSAGVEAASIGAGSVVEAGTGGGETQSVSTSAGLLAEAVATVADGVAGAAGGSVVDDKAAATSTGMGTAGGSGRARADGSEATLIGAVGATSCSGHTAASAHKRFNTTSAIRVKRNTGDPPSPRLCFSRHHVAETVAFVAGRSSSSLRGREPL